MLDESQKFSGHRKGFEDILSEIEEVKGTEPVRRTTIIPNVNKVIPSDREKYSSRAVFHQSGPSDPCMRHLRVGSRTSGERRVIMMVGDTIKGAA